MISRTAAQSRHVRAHADLDSQKRRTQERLDWHVSGHSPHRGVPANPRHLPPLRTAIQPGHSRAIVGYVQVVVVRRCPDVLRSPPQMHYSACACPDPRIHHRGLVLLFPNSHVRAPAKAIPHSCRRVLAQVCAPPRQFHRSRVCDDSRRTGMAQERQRKTAKRHAKHKQTASAPQRLSGPERSLFHRNNCGLRGWRKRVNFSVRKPGGA